MKLFKFNVFCRFGIQRKRFFPLWDTTEEFFSAVGYNGKGFPPLWDTTEEDFFHCWIQQRTISGWQTNFFLLYPTTREIFLPLYPTPQQNLMQCTEKSSALYPTTLQVFFRCIPQWKIFSSIVGYSGRVFFFVVGDNKISFPPLWDTTEEAFFHFGIQRKRFFLVWDTMEKIIQRRIKFLKFKCLSLSSNNNLGKICYLNSQTNPRKELKMENYMVNHEKKKFHCGIQRSREFF